MSPDSRLSALSVILNITASFPGNHGRIGNKFLKKMILVHLVTFPWKHPFFQRWLMTYDLWYKLRNRKWFLAGTSLLSKYSVSSSLPHQRSGLLTPLVGLAMWLEWPVKCEQLWNDHIWAEVDFCGVGSVLLPFTTGQHASASCCSLIPPKIGDTGQPWIPPGAMLKCWPTYPPARLEFCCWKPWQFGEVVYIQHLIAQANILKQTFP